MKRQKGQIVLLLILVMTVALAIGLSVIQRSLSDISTASRVEESSRAFSAAEAGIETALGTGSIGLLTLPNNSEADVTNSDWGPEIQSGTTGPQSPLEYPPLGKEETAHVWFADPDSTANPPTPVYKQQTLDVYWGNSSTERAALELTIVYYDSNGNQYKSQKLYLDQIIRTPPNNFDTTADCSGDNAKTPTPPGSFKNYQCYKSINLPASPAQLMLLRARLLYNTTYQPFAAQATGTCGLSCSLPGQARTLTSTGTFGKTQRKVQLFQEKKVVPPYMDFAIFSDSEINK